MPVVIMAGCDLHDKTMLVKASEGRQKARTRSFRNTQGGRQEMIGWLRAMAPAESGAVRIVLAYEASGLGFGLYDELSEAGIVCHVLAPTKMATSRKHRSGKTDEHDAERILELVRGAELAGNELPAVWVPDPRTREDREVVRARLDAGGKWTALKAQVRCLLKRQRMSRRPSGLGKGWTVGYWAWLRELSEAPGALTAGARCALRSLLRQMEAMEKELEVLDQEIQSLSATPRYAEPVQALTERLGVGILTAMVFLSELGDLSRFSNRKQVGGYLGLVPRSHETGEKSDHKGHITHQGSARVRQVLCQAGWNVVRHNPVEQSVFTRLVTRNPKRKKIAVVACMRRLGIWMWHRGLEAQRRAGSFPRQEPAA
jgi:transposase